MYFFFAFIKNALAFALKQQISIKQTKNKTIMLREKCQIDCNFVWRWKQIMLRNDLIYNLNAILY